MATVYMEFDDSRQLGTYLAATPGLILNTSILARTNGVSTRLPKHVLFCEIWHPPTNAVVRSLGRRTLCLDARAQVGTATARWWEAGVDDHADYTGGVVAENTLVSDKYKGNGRTMYFGTSPGDLLQFRSAIIHVHGTVDIGGTESITLYGVTPSGGLVELGTGAITNPGGGAAAINVTTADDVSSYVGIQFATANIAPATSFHVDILLVADAV